MSNRLLIAIVIGIVAAVATVLLAGGAAAHVYIVGQLFLGLLQMLIVPLIMLSVMSGITDLGDVRRLGKLGGWTVVYYAATMLVAAVVGLVVVNVLEPGVGIDTAGLALNASEAPQSDLQDVALGFVGSNVFASMAQMQLVPVILFSLFFGAVLTTIGEQGAPLVRIIDAGNAVMMKMVRIVVWTAPVGIYGLVAGRFGAAMAEGGREALVEQLLAVGRYVVAVCVALGIHALVVLPLILVVVARRNPIRYARRMLAALVTAFSTASSSATLPVTLDAVGAERDGDKAVDGRAARFVLPLGATVNMDGSALYEAMAAMFIAQAAGIDLGFGDQVVIVVVATLAAMGAAGVPEAGLVTMVIVLRATNLPLEGLELLLPIDWLLDRGRTAVNVWGDSVGAAVLEPLAADTDLDADVGVDDSAAAEP